MVLLSIGYVIILFMLLVVLRLLEFINNVFSSPFKNLIWYMLWFLYVMRKVVTFGMTDMIHFYHVHMYFNSFKIILYLYTILNEERAKPI